MIFFENERAWGCEQRGRKFAITYTYTWFDIFWWIFRDFLGIFRKIDIFGNFWDFWKSDPGTTRGRLLGKARVENLEKWGKNQDLRNKRCVLPEFAGLWPHFRVPQGLIRILHFPKSSKFPKMLILQHFIKRHFQKVIFCEIERACGCVWVDPKFAITYTYTWFSILWWIFSWFCYSEIWDFSNTTINNMFIPYIFI